MPRPTHEASRDPAARATDSSADHADSPGQSNERREAVTDEGLGLQLGRAPTDEERRGGGLVGRANDVPEPEPVGQRTGSLRDATAPSGQAEVIDEESDLTTTPHLLDGADAATPDLEPSFMDQDLLTDPMSAPGAPDKLSDPVADGDEVYVPPTDPVVGTSAHGETRVLGGFSTSAPEEIVPRRSASDGEIGDEALVDAVQSALRHDATTTDLAIEVTVERGIVRLRGTVTGLEDVDNAEAVAGRVTGVVDVVDELQVAEL